MHNDRTGQIAVIFLSVRTESDAEGYAAAAEAMEALASRQPGFRGIDSTRGADGFGITISYWADEPSALAWRANPEHSAIRDQGRGHWYRRYEVIVCTVDRAYSWARP